MTHTLQKNQSMQTDLQMTGDKISIWGRQKSYITISKNYKKKNVMWEMETFKEVSSGTSREKNM